MNKKIKVIDLIDKKYHNLELPKHIRINKLEYFYNENRKTYDSEYGEQMSFDFTDNVLNMEVEILEDNTEEIEELDTLNAYKLIESPYMAKLLKEQRYDEFMEHLKQSEVEIANTIMKAEDKINELIKAVNEIRKDLNNE